VCVGTNTSARFPEPHTDDGIDFVLYPGTKEQPGGVFSKVAGLLPFKKSAVPVKPAEKVEPLLNKHVPIQTIIRKHKLGLDHALKEGVMIEDFLANGYRLKDLAEYEYISQEGTRRALVTLTSGLGLCANHLRDYSHLLPIKEVRDVTGLETSEICTVLGLEFPEDKPLECFGDTEWNLRDCVALGLTMSDLFEFGLQSKQQYGDLMLRMSKSEIVKAEAALEATEEQVASLIDLKALQLEEEARVRQAVMNAKKVRVQPQPQQPDSSSEEQEEEEEEEEDEEEAPPPAPVPKKSVPVRKVLAADAAPRRTTQYARHGFVDTPKK